MSSQFCFFLALGVGVVSSKADTDSAEVEQLVRKKGMFSFYEDGHKECCGVRKVGPLKRQLGTLKVSCYGPFQ